MSWTPAPAGLDADSPTPVTVYLTPAQAVRLELVLAHHRDHTGLDDEVVCDAIFETGLKVAERDLQNHG